MTVVQGSALSFLQQSNHIKYAYKEDFSSKCMNAIILNTLDISKLWR